MTPRLLTRLLRAGATLAVALAVLGGCGLQPSARVVSPVGPVLAQSMVEQPRPEPAAPVELPAVTGALELRAVDLAFSQRTISVASPGLYAVTIVNADTVRHEVGFDDGTTLVVAPGERATAQVVVPAEGTAFYCMLAGHRDAGMVGQVLVEAAP